MSTNLKMPKKTVNYSTQALYFFSFSVIISQTKIVIKRQCLRFAAGFGVPHVTLQSSGRRWSIDIAQVQVEGMRHRVGMEALVGMED